MDTSVQAQLQELLQALPKPIQRAITSANVQKQLRELADKHRLHLDQWQILENEVLLSLFGIKPIRDLEKNIGSEVKVSGEIAAGLAGDISQLILAPIREELERELEHPEAKAKEESGVDQARASALREAAPADAGAPPPPPPPPPPPSTGSTASTNSGQASSPQASSGQAVAQVQPATPPPPPPTDKSIRAPTSAAYNAGEPSTTRKNVHDDPYREPPA